MMITTVKFRLHPTGSQELQLHEIFTIYNRVKRKGYILFFNKRDILFSKDSAAKKELDKEIHRRLMQACHNNPYVNSIRIDCKTKLAQQKTWVGKRETYLTHQVSTILDKIENIKEVDRKDRRLKGLYSRTIIASTGQAGTHPIQAIHSSSLPTITLSPRSSYTPIGHVLTQVLQLVHIFSSSVTLGNIFTYLSG